MIAWRIWYRDGSFYDSSMGPPEDAPKRGVEFIRYVNATHNALVAKGAEYYLMEHGSSDWYELRSLVDLTDWVLFQLADIRVILKGCSMDTPQFEALYKRVMEDPDFMQRAGGKTALEDTYHPK